jgi:hypothetical protein
MRYKIIYHVGDEINIKTKVAGGVLTLQDGAIQITGPSPFEVPLTTLTSVEMFRLHGLGRMLKLQTKDKTMFLTVVRFYVSGYFALINFLKTGELHKKLAAGARKPVQSDTDSR